MGRKDFIPYSISFLLIFILCIGYNALMGREKKKSAYQAKHGTAIVITGAAARISQEAALLEQLYSKGMLNDVVFISGASSGGLNAVVLNGILTGKISWNEYRQFLSNISNDDVFSKNDSKLPVDTDPLRKLISQFISDKLGYKTLSDLPYPTSLSVVNLKAVPLKERTLRLCNRKINPESDSSLDLIDVLMATTSYPIAFPPSYIRNVKTIPNVQYYDGGILEDRVPYEAVLEFEQYMGIHVDRMIIISRKRDTIPSINDELKQFGVEEIKVLDRIRMSPENYSNISFYKGLKELSKHHPELAEKTYVYLPDMAQTFLMFDFNTLEKQYEITKRWAQTNYPIPLKLYLELNRRHRDFFRLDSIRVNRRKT